MTEYRGIEGNALAASPLPKDDDLFLIGVRGEWPISTAASEANALQMVRTRTEGTHHPGSWVRVYRVVAIDLQEVEVQQEIVRQALVPKGTAVTS